MKNPISQLNFLFFSTLMAILIWMASPSVKGNISSNLIPFPLAEYEARYAVSWHGMSAGQSIHRLVRRADGQYHFETRTEPHMRFLPFHYVESTDFAWHEGKIQPQNYYYNIREGKRHKEGNVSFNWNTHQIKNMKLAKPWIEAMPQDVHDKLTQTLALRQALKAGHSKLSYQVAEEDKLKNHSFTVLGEEQVHTKVGTVSTLKLEHISRKGYRTTLWLAKKWDYLPVKMTQMRNGKIVASGEILAFSPK